ncbi:MAG: SPOR domain-containing protein [Gammaproteobacteria bacterium]|nr:SPOR domain-containing protein [Gammaproteobacteria bacterium]
MRSVLFAAGLALAGAALPLPAAPAALTVEEAAAAEVVGPGRFRVALAPGDALYEGDSVRVLAQGRLRLRLGTHGRLELGPHARVHLERLPHAAYAADRTTLLRLDHGYLRLSWLPPPDASYWPLFLRVNERILTPGAGEYFVERRPQATTACLPGPESAAARLSGMPQPLLADYCYTLKAGKAPTPRRDPAPDWIAVRNSWSLDPATPMPAPLEAEPVPIPAPAAPPPLEASAAPAVQAEVPVPAAAEAEPAPVQESWTVVLISLPSAAAAEKEARKLKKAGHAASVAPVEVKGETWYRVQLAGFTEQAAAQAKARQLRRKGYKGAWVAPSPG